MALLGFFLPPYAAAGIQTHVSRTCTTLWDPNSGPLYRLSYSDRGWFHILVPMAKTSKWIDGHRKLIWCRSIKRYGATEASNDTFTAPRSCRMIFNNVSEKKSLSKTRQQTNKRPPFKRNEYGLNETNLKLSFPASDGVFKCCLRAFVVVAKDRFKLMTWVEETLKVSILKVRQNKAF